MGDTATSQDAVATGSWKRQAQILPGLWREAGLLTPSPQLSETHFRHLASRTGKESIPVVLSGTICYSSHGKLIRRGTNSPNAGGINQPSALGALRLAGAQLTRLPWWLSLLGGAAQPHLTPFSWTRRLARVVSYKGRNTIRQAAICEA